MAAPLATANLAQMAMGLTDTIMVGSLGAVPLAAVGLGSGLYFTGVIVCAGVLSAVAPLAAFALGAGDRAAVGRVTASGLLLAAVLTLPVVAAMLMAERLLGLIGYEPSLTEEIGRYLRAILWGAPGFLGFAVLRCLFATLSRARVVMIVLLPCLPVNAALNWVLVFGHSARRRSASPVPDTPRRSAAGWSGWGWQRRSRCCRGATRHTGCACASPGRCQISDAYWR